MPYIELAQKPCNGVFNEDKKKIMLFTEGTILGHKNLRELLNFSTYRPIGDCVKKIQFWEQQGAEILYFTSRRSKRQVADILSVLKQYDFTGTRLYYRAPRQKYKDIIETVRPDILIEDDCKSIGGSLQMCITYVRPEVRNKITSIVVPEFKGIDYLPEILPEMFTDF